jgi:hypothetical protein
MVPDSGEASDSASADPDHPGPSFDEVAMYRLVRPALDDAIPGSIVPILLVGVALVLVGVGDSVAVQGSGETSAAVGVAVVLLGLYLPARRWSSSRRLASGSDRQRCVFQPRRDQNR